MTNKSPSTRRKFRSIGFALLCAAVGSVALASPGLAQQGEGAEAPPVKVSTARARESMMAPQMQVPGTVISRNDSRIATEITGRIVWVAEVGDSIKAGAPVARIDDRLYQLEVTRAGANVKRLQADLDYRGKDVARMEELVATNNTPTSRLEQSISQRDMIAQNLVQALAELDRAEEDLRRANVPAPFPGRVVQRLAQIGEYASMGMELVRLVDTAHVEVRAQVSIAAAPYIRDGMEVAVMGDDARTLTPIRSVVPVGDEVSRMMEVRITIPADMWVIGSAVRVSLPSSEARKVVSVPRDALILRADSTFIFRVNDERIAERVAVTTGAASGDQIEVRGDVAADDEVVIRGGERLREGQRVTQYMASLPSQS